MDFIFNSVNIILPLFLMGAVGYVLNLAGWISEKTAAQINRIAFDVFFPCSFFMSSYNGGGKIDISRTFILAIVLVETGSFVLTYFIARMLSRKVEEQGAMQQTMFRSNMILFGTAIANSLLAAEEQAVYTVALLVILPMQNIGCIVGKEMFGNIKDGKISVPGVVKGVLSSSNVISIILGLVIGNLGIRLPSFLTSALTDFGAAGPPIQLMLLGASLQVGTMRKYAKKLAAGVCVKLFLMSSIVVPFISFFGMSFAESFVLLLLCSAPSAVTTFTVSKREGWNLDLVNGMILLTTVCSLFTLTFWMYILQVLS